MFSSRLVFTHVIVETRRMQSGIIDRPSCALDGCIEQTVDGVRGWVSPSCVSITLRVETSNRSGAIFESLGRVFTEAVFQSPACVFSCLYLMFLFTQSKKCINVSFYSAVQSQSRSGSSKIILQSHPTWTTACLSNQRQNNYASVNISVSDYPFRYFTVFTDYHNVNIF